MDTDLNRIEKDRRTRRNAVYMVLALFFVAVVSATAGFLQGQHTLLATTPVGNLAAASVTVGADKELTVDGNRVQTLSCVGTRCVGSADGKSLVISCRDSRTCAGTFDGETIELSQQATNAVAQRIVQAKNATDSCLEGQGDECRNRCSTTYVSINSTLPLDIEMVDCYGTPGDPMKPALELLAQCIGRSEVTLRPTGTTQDGSRVLSLNTVVLGEPELREALCMDRRAVAFAEDNEYDVTVEAQAQNGERLIIPERCRDILEDIIALRDGRDAQGSATRGEAQVCAWKGAVTCVASPTITQPTVAGGPAGLPRIGESYTCVSKTAQTSTRGASRCGDGVGGFVCTIGEGIRGITRGIGSNEFARALGQIVGSISFRGIFSSDNDEDRGRCAAGYVESREGGRIVCRADRSRNNDPARTPQCAITTNVSTAAAGESVVVRWRTLDAERVAISGVGNNLPQSGERAVTIDATTEFILTAHGAQNNDATCSTLVLLDGSGGPSGDNPPRLTCEAPIVKPGEESIVKWACIASADSTTGENINTNGAISGEVAVNPTHNTEYSVTCLDENSATIGKNSCSVLVGEPLADITVHPKEATRGDRVRVAWGSLFMDSCRVRGPRGFDFNQAQGVVITEPFSTSKTVLPDNQIRAAIYSIECRSVFDDTITKEVSVDFVEEED